MEMIDFSLWWFDRPLIFKEIIVGLAVILILLLRRTVSSIWRRRDRVSVRSFSNAGRATINNSFK